MSSFPLIFSTCKDTIITTLSSIFSSPASAFTATDTFKDAGLLQLADDFFDSAFRQPRLLFQFFNRNRRIDSDGRQYFLVTFLATFLVTFPHHFPKAHMIRMVRNAHRVALIVSDFVKDEGSSI